MKVKNLIEALLRLPAEHELVIERDTNYGRVEYDYSHLEVRREVKPIYHREMITPESMKIMMEDDWPYIAGIEETSERCIMVLN